jgi:hypothetical protein
MATRLPATSRPWSRSIRITRHASYQATDTCQADPELAAVVAAWDRLPEAVRAGIVAIVKAAVK